MRLIGLEPTQLALPDPKSGASTNFATGAEKERVKHEKKEQNLINNQNQKKTHQLCVYYSLFSDLGAIRTHDPQFRRLLLYPTELQGHINLVLYLRLIV